MTEIHCRECVQLRRAWYAASIQLKADGVPLPESQQAIIRRDRMTAEYQAALQNLRDHLQTHQEEL